MITSVLLIGLSACFNWGTRPDSFTPAQSPSGARVAVRVQGETSDRVGELLAVDSTGITIRDRAIVHVAWARVAAVDVAQLGSDYDIRFGERVTPDKRARLALVSRFPQGLANLPITVDSLIAAATPSIARFADRRVASEAGYKRVGADFPAMGEHWLNPSLLLSGTIDPARPTFLIYANVHGAPTLLGGGFAIVTRGDSVPHDAPGWPDRWHEHSGLLSDESGARLDITRTPSDTHVWVMHTWTVLTNPDGAFAAENWALPYLRAGRVIPGHVDASAGRALSLVSDGDAFLRALLTDAGFRTDSTAAAIDHAIDGARVRASQSTRDDELNDVWARLRDELMRIAGPRVVTVLEPTHAAHMQSGGSDR
jgi:hypothetical protein